MSVPSATLSPAMVVARLTFVLPSIDTVPVTSPVSVMFLAFAHLVAVVALPLMSLVVSAIVPAVVGSVIVMSPDGFPPTSVVSLLSAVDPSKTTPLLVLTVSTLAVVVVPVTTRSPGMVMVSLPAPMVRSLLDAGHVRREAEHIVLVAVDVRQSFVDTLSF